MLSQLFTTFAAGCTSSVTSFFGLIPWYGYLPAGDFDGQCNITKFNVLPASGTPSDIPLILLAGIEDLLRVAGLVAVGFLIYAAVRYVTSQGNPEQTAKAQNTVISALVGLVIAMVAVVFVSFLGNALK
jgi:hypothetical protein